MKILTST